MMIDRRDMSKIKMHKKRHHIPQIRMPRKRKNNAHLDRHTVILVVLFFLVALAVQGTGSMKNGTVVNVRLKAENVEIRQEENIPKLKAKVEVEGNRETILDKERGYTVQDLVDELESGKGYELECQTDGTKEGRYPIKIRLDGDFEETLMGKYLNKLQLETKEGALTVSNKYGTWDGDKFKRYDGTYVEKDFIESKGDTYYLDDKGKKVTGWQTLNSYTYYFDKDGKMKTGWMENKDEKYYFNSDGTMHIGWLTENEDKYYFDKDGKMMTGEQQVGIRHCVFGKDGKLETEDLSIDVNKPMIALTFDDGPGARTKELLEVLKENGARATFFMVGENIPNHPDTIKLMEDIGCELGNHTAHHENLTKLNESGIQAAVGDVNTKLSKIVGHGATSLRPPYGAKNDLVKKTAGLPLVLWSVDTEDWKLKNKEATYKAIMNGAKDGNIILLHDIHSWSVDAAIEAIPQLVARGFQLVTVSELADARDVQMQNGESYFSFPKQQ